jgi:hypothetical protein
MNHAPLSGRRVPGALRIVASVCSAAVLLLAASWAVASETVRVAILDNQRTVTLYSAARLEVDGSRRLLSESMRCAPVPGAES